MPGIFISYRRDDSGYHALRLHERLSKHFGRDFVFIDVASLPWGVDFSQVLNKRLSHCEVVLVLIGKRWVSITDSTGRLRLNDPDDFVRLEIEASLHRNIRVVPVLVGGAQMPSIHELPATIIDLAYLNGFIIHEHTFDDSVRRLIESIAPLVSYNWWNYTGPRLTSTASRQEYSLVLRRLLLLPEILYPIVGILILFVATMVFWPIRTPDKVNRLTEHIVA